jgi:hypothetical protein
MAVHFGGRGLHQNFEQRPPPNAKVLLHFSNNKKHKQLQGQKWNIKKIPYLWRSNSYTDINIISINDLVIIVVNH